MGYRYGIRNSYYLEVGPELIHVRRETIGEGEKH